MRSFLPSTEFIPSALDRESLDVKIQRARRTKYIGTAALLGSTFLGLDTAAGIAKWQGDAPAIVAIDRPHVVRASAKTGGSNKQHDSATMFVFGGFGVSNDRLAGIGKAVDTALGGVEPVVTINHADTGIDIDEIADQVGQYVESHDLTKIDFYGHSMGGMVSLEVAAQLKEKDDVRVRSVTLDSTPAGIQNVRGSDRGGTKLLQTLNDANLHFGPAMRVGMEATRMIFKDPRSLMDIDTYKTAVRRAENDAPNPLIQSQAAFVDDFEIDKYEGVFSVKTTKITQLAPKDNDRDHTVNDAQAFIDFEKGLGRPIDQKLLKNTGHASIQSDPLPYGKALKEVWATFDETTPNDNYLVIKPPKTSGDILAVQR
jgi:pimeloyl-ACP methyl ester carboxylesterase